MIGRHAPYAVDSPRHRRRGLSATLIAAGAALILPGQTSAIPGTGPHETVDVTTSTMHPSTAGAFTYAATYRNPANPSADPPALRRLVISLPAGTRIDTSVPARCDASDQQIRVMGDAACPPASRVGSGQATADITGIGRMTFNTTLFNGADQQIEVVESANGLGSNGVVRTFIHGSTLDGPVPTCLSGGQPPTGCPFDQVVLLANHLTALPVTVGQGASQRSYGTTPPTCPASGRWQTPVTLYYADGAVETVVTTQPCVQPRAPVGPSPHKRGATRRHRRHARPVLHRRLCRDADRDRDCDRHADR